MNEAKMSSKPETESREQHQRVKSLGVSTGIVPHHIPPMPGPRPVQGVPAGHFLEMWPDAYTADSSNAGKGYEEHIPLLRGLEEANALMLHGRRNQ